MSRNVYLNFLRILLFIISVVTITGCRTLGGVSGGNVVMPVSYRETLSPDSIEYKLLARPRFIPTSEESVQLRQVNVRYIDSTESELKECKLINKVQTFATQIVFSAEAENIYRLAALREDSDTAVVIKNDHLIKDINGLEGVQVLAYQCGQLIRGNEFYDRLGQTRASKEIGLFLGQYIKRDGILENLGDKFATFGIQYNSYFPTWEVDAISPRYYGYFLHWSFDHFPNTNPRYLGDVFKGKNFTSYLVAGGLTLRMIFKEHWQATYSIGPALNFIEIDTNGGDRKNDSLFTDTTSSVFHKVGIYYFPEKFEAWKAFRPLSFNGFGLSMMYYSSLAPLGKFLALDMSKYDYPGGSYAALIEIKFESY